MQFRLQALLPLLAAATSLAAIQPAGETKSITLTWKDPGTFFTLNWGSNAVKSGPDQCHSYPEQWLDQCRLNAAIIDSLDVRLNIKDVDWRSLEREAQHLARKIERCLNGKRPSAAPAGCYEEGESNIVSREFRDQFGGRWIVYAAQGYPSEGRFDEPLWANAILQHVGPVHARFDSKGRLLAVMPPPNRRIADAQGLENEMENARRTLER